MLISSFPGSISVGGFGWGRVDRRPRRASLRGTGRLESLEERVVLSTIVVTNLDDSGAGSLRAAIEQANLDPGSDTIRFLDGLSGTISLTGALPDLSTAIALEGPGPSTLTVARPAVPGSADFRIFSVTAGGQVAISGLVISGGRGNRGGRDQRTREI